MNELKLKGFKYNEKKFSYNFNVFILFPNLY